MSTRDSLPATMTVKEFADLMNISPRSAYRAIENGHVPVIRFGRNIIVPAHPVYAMLGIPTDQPAFEPVVEDDEDVPASGRPSR